MPAKSDSILKLTSTLLNWLWIASWVGLILYMLLLLSLTVTYFNNNGAPVPLATQLPIHFMVTAPVSDPNMIIDTDAPGSLGTIDDAVGTLNINGTQWWLFALGPINILLRLAIVLVILTQLSKIVAAVRSQQPFVADNLKRIRIIAYSVLVYYLVIGLYGFVTSQIIDSQLAMNLYQPNIVVQPVWQFFNLEVIVFVLVILVIERTFRMGLELQTDKDLTV